MNRLHNFTNNLKTKEHLISLFPYLSQWMKTNSKTVKNFLIIII